MPKTYQQRKDQINQINQAKSLSGRDIGALPLTKDKSRKNKCKNDLKLFCETYFKNLFTQPFSADHIEVIQSIETAALNGGLQAIAMPRGSGKTTICEVAAIWVLLYGHRKFVVLIGATEQAAKQTLDNIKMEFETNQMLVDDFPEAIYPILKLDGIANRVSGQLFQGERTRIAWTANEVALPTIAGSQCSGSAIRVAGITGRLRGMKITTADGCSIRPDFVLLDDIQTSESAASVMQTQKRLDILNGDVLGLAGPGRKISGIMPLTVIQKGDLADLVLDKTKHPDWRGKRTKLLYDMPTATDLWQKYEDIRAESLRNLGNISLATKFYKENQIEMDTGAKVAWSSRFNPDEISAIQNCMNLLIQDKKSFYAEYQNDPLALDYYLNDKQLQTQDFVEKLNNLKQGVVPLACDKLVMYVDVQKAVIFYVITAFKDDFTSAVIEYGTYPKQTSANFNLHNLRSTLQNVYPTGGVEAQIYAGLKDFITPKLNMEYYREDGLVLKVEKCLIDAQWNESTEIVKQFCRQSQFAPMLLPAHGDGITAGKKPMSTYTKKAGDKFYYNCYIPGAVGKYAVKHINIDTNSWKSFVAERIIVPMGQSGCLSIYGNNKTNHDLLFVHLTSEYFVSTFGNGRYVKEWKLKPNRDNHWFDCLVGTFVGANVLGCTLPEIQNTKPVGQKISLAKKQQEVVETELETGIESSTTTNGKLSLKALQEQKRRR